MDAVVVAVSLDRDLSRHVVGLRRARVGRLLGVGPGGERIAPAVAHHDRVPPLGDDPGKARHVEKWNLALIIGSWLLSIFGTFITRSGVISSVHSFTQSSVGYFFLAFLIVMGTASFVLYTNRLPLLSAEAQLESMVSREASFLFNNLLFIGIAFSVLWGTLFPILSELVQGTKVTVGPPFFNQVNIPLGLALLALTGIGPLIAWRRASVPNLQRQFAVPGTVGVFTALILLVGGMRDFYALTAIV